MAVVPSTPTTTRQQQQDPFSSPARDVCWSPSASIPLLDVLFREEEDSRSSPAVQRASHSGVPRAGRTVWPVSKSREEDTLGIASPAKSASSSQVRIECDDIFLFLMR